MRQYRPLPLIPIPPVPGRGEGDPVLDLGWGEGWSSFLFGSWGGLLPSWSFLATLLPACPSASCDRNPSCGQIDTHDWNIVFPRTTYVVGENLELISEGTLKRKLYYCDFYVDMSKNLAGGLFFISVIFLKAEDLSPGKWKDNMLHIAKVSWQWY